MNEHCCNEQKLATCKRLMNSACSSRLKMQWECLPQEADSQADSRHVPARNATNKRLRANDEQSVQLERREC